MILYRIVLPYVEHERYRDVVFRRPSRNVSSVYSVWGERRGQGDAEFDFVQASLK